MVPEDSGNAAGGGAGVIAAVMMAITIPRLAGLTALVIPGVLLPILVFGRRVQKLSRYSQDRLADASAIANETLNAATAVKAYHREDIESRRYSHAVDRALDTARRRIGATSKKRSSTGVHLNQGAIGRAYPGPGHPSVEFLRSEG